MHKHPVKLCQNVENKMKWLKHPINFRREIIKNKHRQDPKDVWLVDW